MRKQLSNTGADATLMIDWVDRIHKDALHTSFYNYLNMSSQTIATVSGTSNYTLTGTIRRVVSVYDRTRERILLPLDVATHPVPQAEKAGDSEPPEGQVVPRPLARAKLLSSLPEYFSHTTSTNSLILYPTPKQALTIEIISEGQVATLAALGTTLVVPEDGKDMLVAGVNYLAANYLKRAPEVQVWFQIYERLKLSKVAV